MNKLLDDYQNNQNWTLKITGTSLEFIIFIYDQTLDVFLDSSLENIDNSIHVTFLPYTKLF